jgi:hypothetical protein
MKLDTGQPRRAGKNSLAVRGLRAVSAVLLLAITQLLATPPDSINLSFDSSSHILSVRIFHPTRNVATHHIAGVAVALNQAPIITQKINTQTDQNEQDVAYTIIDAQPADKLSLTATCSVFGKMTVTLDVPADSGGP